MGFESLLGNDRLKETLSRSIQNGHISHFYLICGPEGSGRHTLARLLAAAILCQNDKKPCCSCKACRKVLEGSHPDFITVDDPEKKTVSVELVRQARADIYIQPNESDHKIYLFPRAQDMGIPGQNALLKVLEEPPAYGVFLLLTDNPERLLPTIRSRCTLLQLQPLSEKILTEKLSAEFPNAKAQDIQGAVADSGGFLGQAMALLGEGSALAPQTVAFAENYAAGDHLGLTRVLVGMEKTKRDALISLLNQWLKLLENALACRCGGSGNTEYARNIAVKRQPRELMQGVCALQKAIEYAQGNVSPAAICGWLAWELR